jgi:hypothetical protein
LPPAALAAANIKTGEAATAWPRSIFPAVPILLTEAGTKHRASLHVFAGVEDLSSVDPGGIDIFTSDLELLSRRTTVKTTLSRELLPIRAC